MKRALQIAFGLMFALPAPATKAQMMAVSPTQKSIPAIAQSSKGAIVTIFMTLNDKPLSLGTGFVVSWDGTIVTNYHVIASGNVAVAKFPDGTAFPVDGVLAADKVRDLAIIKIHGKAFRTLMLGNSDEVQVGEEVVAIGNPMSLESTVSNGIISGVRASKKQGGSFLQTTAPISPGSSGGPLFNMAGEVVGINAMYFEGGENLNFAIPINDAKGMLRSPARLHSLPNEAPAPEEHAKQEAAPSGKLTEQMACKDAADSFAQQLKNDLDSGWSVEIEKYSTYTNHFDQKTNACYLSILGDRKPPYGAKYHMFKRDIYNVLENKVAAFLIENSISQTENSDGFFKTPSSAGPDYRDMGLLCFIYPPNQESIACKNEREFNALALKYFGVTQ